MNFEWDDQKNARNKRLHGLSFDAFEGFDDEPVVLLDERQDYGEPRLLAFGRINGRGHCVVFTMRGSTARLISFRRARDKEVQRYDR